MGDRLTHIDDAGRARMVEVTEKEESEREAVARGFVHLSPEVLRLLKTGKLKKGDPLETARIAGIMAAKKTSDLIPLCHPLPLTVVDVDARVVDDGVEIEARVVCVGKTGVEMEAMTAVAVAALTVYDMCKAVDKGITISGIQLLRKRGGRSGEFVREP
jgi:cyclic pyranopterin phosphate synthase